MYLFSSFLIKALSFITTPIFTRLMSTSDFGIVSNFVTWTSFFAMFICMQVSSGVVSAKINRGPERIDEYMASIIRIAIVFAFIISAVTMAFREPIARLIEVDVSYVALLLVVAFGSSMTNVYSGYCVATEQPKRKVAFSIITAVLNISLCLVLVIFSTDKAAGRIYGYTITNLLIALYVVMFLFTKKRGQWNEVKKDIIYALSFGVPLIPHLLANLINGNADRVFLIKIWGDSAAGIYSVAYSIGMVALALANACTDAWTPWYFEETKNGNKKEIGKYFTVYSVTVAMCFFGIMMLAPEVMKIMASKEYYSGTSAIGYIALGIFFLFMYHFPLCYEQYHGNTKFVAPATIVGALVNVGLNIYIIPRYGVDGAAFTTLISYIVLLVLHEIVARKIIKGYNIPLIKYALPCAIAVIGFAVSKVTLEMGVIRYVITAAFCAFYVAYMSMFLRRRTD